MKYKICVEYLFWSTILSPKYYPLRALFPPSYSVIITPICQEVKELMTMASTHEINIMCIFFIVSFGFWKCQDMHSYVKLNLRYSHKQNGLTIESYWNICIFIWKTVNIKMTGTHYFCSIPVKFFTRNKNKNISSTF